MDIREDLLAAIAAYCEAAGIKQTTFGRLAVNDGKFVARLRDGKGVTLGTVERARAYMRDHPPVPKGAAA